MEAMPVDSDKWQPKHNRSRIEIIADILRLLRLGNTGKTQITAYAYLRQDQALKYINRLMDSGLLESTDEEMGLPSYRITRKGLAILSLIENLKEMLPADGTTEILHKTRILEVNVGQVLVTRGVAALARQNRKFADFVKESLDRHRKGDWGEMDDEVRQLNHQNSGINTRLFSSYETAGFPEIWITTEPDSSFSTIMFPDEDISMEPREDYSLLATVEPRKGKETFGAS
jgi:predicted transcriptional regulator